MELSGFLFFCSALQSMVLPLVCCYSFVIPGGWLVDLTVGIGKVTVVEYVRTLHQGSYIRELLRNIASELKLAYLINVDLSSHKVLHFTSGGIPSIFSG